MRHLRTKAACKWASFPLVCRHLDTQRNETGERIAVSFLVCKLVMTQTLQTARTALVSIWCNPLHERPAALRFKRTQRAVFNIPSLVCCCLLASKEPTHHPQGKKKKKKGEEEEDFDSLFLKIYSRGLSFGGNCMVSCRRLLTIT